MTKLPARTAGLVESARIDLSPTAEAYAANIRRSLPLGLWAAISAAGMRQTRTSTYAQNWTLAVSSAADRIWHDKASSANCRAHRCGAAGDCKPQLRRSAIIAVCDF